MKINRPRLMALLAFTLAGTAATPLAAQTRSNAATDNVEIEDRQYHAYSGPAAAYGLIGRTIAAYFKKMNAEGGINGRKLNFISYDDLYDPAKATQAAHKLVEDDQVLLVFQSLGTPSNTAHPKIPERQQDAAAVRRFRTTKWDDPDASPLTMGRQPN